MVRNAALIGMLALSGCNMSSALHHKHRENDPAFVNPPGRYQMIPTGKGDGSVLILDTRYGNVRQCGLGATPLTVVCGPMGNTPS